jgi:hypothetical protein
MDMASVKFKRLTLVGSHCYSPGEVADIDDYRVDHLVESGSVERLSLIERATTPRTRQPDKSDK